MTIDIEEGLHPDPDVPVVAAEVTCHTKGCDEEDITKAVWIARVSPLVVCGTCAQQITDIHTD